MADSADNEFPVLSPDLQVSFCHRLGEINDLYLHDALRQTVASTDIAALDRELASLVGARYLNHVASYGLRGEIFFPAPLLIETNPRLLGYYRLLLGFSKKEFYNKGPFGRFARLEDSGDLPDQLREALPRLCKSLIGSAEVLVVSVDDPSLELVRDLQILTLGPQLRGGRNTRLGQDATREVYDLVLAIVGSYATGTRERAIRLQNDSDRTVLIEFFADPDVRIIEEMGAGRTRPIVSMEIKGGTDASNVHNRLGEAEKSHQKAKDQGFMQFWTILRAPVNEAQARIDSPTTTHFFDLNDVIDSSTEAHKDFCELLASLVGIRA